jgi:hypothetical protein
MAYYLLQNVTQKPESTLSQARDEPRGGGGGIAPETPRNAQCNAVHYIVLVNTKHAGHLCDLAHVGVGWRWLVAGGPGPGPAASGSPCPSPCHPLSLPDSRL